MSAAVAATSLTHTTHSHTDIYLNNNCLQSLTSEQYRTEAHKLTLIGHT